jgi:hypothetical protein
MLFSCRNSNSAAHLTYPKHSAQAKGSRAFLGNGDAVTF